MKSLGSFLVTAAAGLGALAWPAAGLGPASAAGELVGLDGKAVGTVEVR